MTKLRSSSWRATLCIVAGLTSVLVVACGDDDAPVETDAGETPRDGGTDGGPGSDAGPEPDGGGEPDDDAGLDAGETPPDGGTDAGDTTPIPAPRPISPASTARTTSPTVRFRWELAAPATGARLDICRDPACATILESQDVEGDTVSTLVPPEPLPSSRVFYWRVTGRAGTRLGTTQSPIWSFSVHGRATVTVEGTWGSTNDLTGDGRADPVAGAPGSSIVQVWPGGSPLTTVPSPSVISGGEALGTALAIGGDVNGDGVGDLVVAASRAIHVFHGVLGGWSASVPLASASTTLTSDTALASGRVAIAGDVDGDGYADLVVGEPSERRALVYRGSAVGIDDVATPIQRDLAGFGRSVAGACDVDADGYADVIIGADDAAVVLYGSETGLGPRAAELMPGVSSAGFGTSVSCAGDVNGDGYPDVLVGAPSNNAVFVYHGGSGGIGTSASGVLRKVPGPIPGSTNYNGDQFGSQVAALGDVNGDGFGDIVVIAAVVTNEAFMGSAIVFTGSAAGFGITPPSTPEMPISTTHARAVGSSAPITRSTAAAGAGDVNDDGYDEMIVGRGLSGAVLLYPGGAGSTYIPFTPAWNTAGPTSIGTTVAWLWGYFTRAHREG